MIGQPSKAGDHLSHTREKREYQVRGALFSFKISTNKNIIFAFHSDGHIEPIIPDLAEIGLDILNPIQPCTMDDRRLKKDFGKMLSFWGGINVQKTIPFGSPKDVIEEVKDRINIFGESGGFIISSSHNIQPDINSINNTFVYYWACTKYGKYF